MIATEAIATISVAMAITAVVFAIHFFMTLRRVRIYCERMVDRFDILDQRNHAYSDVLDVIALDGLCEDKLWDDGVLSPVDQTDTHTASAPGKLDVGLMEEVEWDTADVDRLRSMARGLHAAANRDIDRYCARETHGDAAAIERLCNEVETLRRQVEAEDRR